jgi:hypothetical protein
LRISISNAEGSMSRIIDSGSREVNCKKQMLLSNDIGSKCFSVT